MVCAGNVQREIRQACAALACGSAVSSRLRAPAFFATFISASTVDVSPGPDVTRNTSPLPSAGVVMSPTTDDRQAEMEQPHREALDLQRLAAAAIDGDPAGAGEHSQAASIAASSMRPSTSPSSASAMPNRSGLAVRS